MTERDTSTVAKKTSHYISPEVLGHVSEIPFNVKALFWSHVAKADGCWEWQAYRDACGYGRFNNPAFATTIAHRIAYTLTVGLIPDGTEIDHLCRNRGCVRPSHLESVVHHVNMLRSHPATKTHCKRGHELAGTNLITKKRPTGTQARACRTCMYASQAKYKKRRAQEVAHR